MVYLKKINSNIKVIKMSTYNPDCWVLIKLKNIKPDIEHLRVVAGWFGGYTQGSSWKINSGIVDYKYDDVSETYTFMGNSGSSYICPCNLEGEKWCMSGAFSLLDSHKDIISYEIIHADNLSEYLSLIK